MSSAPASGARTRAERRGAGVRGRDWLEESLASVLDQSHSRARGRRRRRRVDRRHRRARRPDRRRATTGCGSCTRPTPASGQPATRAPGTRPASTSPSPTATTWSSPVPTRGWSARWSAAGPTSRSARWSGCDGDRDVHDPADAEEPPAHGVPACRSTRRRCCWPTCSRGTRSTAGRSGTSTGCASPSEVRYEDQPALTEALVHARFDSLASRSTVAGARRRDVDQPAARRPRATWPTGSRPSAGAWPRSASTGRRARSVCSRRVLPDRHVGVLPRGARLHRRLLGAAARRGPRVVEHRTRCRSSGPRCRCGSGSWAGWWPRTGATTSRSSWCGSTRSRDRCRRGRSAAARSSTTRRRGRPALPPELLGSVRSLGRAGPPARGSPGRRPRPSRGRRPPGR